MRKMGGDEEEKSLLSGSINNSSDYNSVSDVDAKKRDFEERLLAFHLKRPVFRYFFLAFACLLTFGSYFCYDNPSALADPMKKELDIDKGQRGVFYTVYSLPNTIMVFVGGLLVDKYFGVRWGGFIFSSLTLFGQILFALGAQVHSYVLMVIGRFVFGLGGESIAVVQFKYVSKVFPEKELALAFAITLSIARIGSAVNMAVEPAIEGKTNVAVALWFGGILCALSLLTALTAAAMDKKMEKVVGKYAKEEDEVIHITDVKKFTFPLWLVFLICVTFYNAVFPFISIATGYLKEKYNYSDEKAGTVTGIPYTVSAVVSPIFGFLVDKIGFNVSFCAASSLGVIGVHAMFQFTNWDPIYAMVLLGFVYSLLAAALWPCVSFIVEQTLTGTAYGLMNAMQNSGLAIGFAVTGVLSYTSDFYLLMGCGLASFLFSIWLYFVDLRHGSTLNHHKPPAEIKEEDKLDIRQLMFAPKEAAQNILPRTHHNIRANYLRKIGISSRIPTSVISSNIRKEGELGGHHNVESDEENRFFLPSSSVDQQGYSTPPVVEDESGALPSRDRDLENATFTEQKPESPRTALENEEVVVKHRRKKKKKSKSDAAKNI